MNINSPTLKDIYFITIVIAIITTQVTFTTCKFYADNGLQQTVAYKFISGRQKNQITQEILNVLGIEHPPKPKSHHRKLLINSYIYLFINHLIEFN